MCLSMPPYCLEVGSYSLTHFNNPCLLLCVFKPFKFKVITDIVVLMSTMFVTVFYSFHPIFCYLILTEHIL